MIVGFLFSLLEAVTHDKVVIVSTSSVSFPPGFFGGRLSAYYPLFALSLLLQLFVLIPLLSWPFEAFSSSRMVPPLHTAKFIAFVCFDSLVDFSV